MIGTSVLKELMSIEKNLIASINYFLILDLLQLFIIQFNFFAFLDHGDLNTIMSIT